MTIRLLSVAAACAMGLLPAAAASNRPKVHAETLYSFTGGSDGGGSFGGLVQDAQGNLYGTTAAGGLDSCDSPIDAPGCGVVFELTPPVSGHGPWIETVLHTFTGTTGADGDGPLAGLTRDAQGNLFGTTETGGGVPGPCVNGCGIAFELSPPSGGAGAWTETVLYRFGATAADAMFPYAGLVQDARGNLYGTTPDGGANGLGTVYELSPLQGGGWSETILHDFQISDGSGPLAGLLLAKDGSLFGTADLGSAGGRFCRNQGNCGTVFHLTPPAPGRTGWTFAVLFRFPGDGRDGLFPLAALVQDASGRLYGTTNNYGLHDGEEANGTVFRLSPPHTTGGTWALKTLEAFTTDGAYPGASVLPGPGGVLFGTTEQAGTANPDGNGLVFALTPPARRGAGWTVTDLYTFSSAGAGAMPMAGVIADTAGRLYGTTSTGGGATCVGPFCGAVYRVTPAE